MIAGYLSDKYDNKFYRAKSIIASTMSFLVVPILSCCFLFTFSFYWSISWYFMEFLFCEGWMSPSIAMIQTVIEQKYKGVAIGMFLFSTNIVSTVGLTVVGQFFDSAKTNIVDLEELQKRYGLILCLNTAIPCLLASFCFYMSGKYYAEFKEKDEAEKLQT